jgi:hypothetical protein
LRPIATQRRARSAGLLHPRDHLRAFSGVIHADGYAGFNEFRLAQEGLIVDRETANLAVKRWLREVANARVHGTTGEVPAERLAIERTQLQPVPTLYGGRSVRALQNPKPVPIIGLQHPLSVYDAFAGGSR